MQGGDLCLPQQSAVVAEQRAGGRVGLDDQPGLFGQRHELGRRDEPDARVLPPEQRLHPHDPAALQLDLGLVEEQQFVPLDRFAQVVERTKGQR